MLNECAWLEQLQRAYSELEALRVMVADSDDAVALQVRMVVIELTDAMLQIEFQLIKKGKLSWPKYGGN